MTQQPCDRFARAVVAVWGLLAALLVSTAARGSEPQWVEQGPGPAVVSGAYTEVTGAVNALAPHPTDPNTLYAATVNGGIWRTRDAEAISPTWVPLTDQWPSLSTTAIVFDPLDATHRTLWAGLGHASSGSPQNGPPNGPLLGLLRTQDEGATWTELGRSTFSGQTISSILPTTIVTPTGQVILVTTWWFNGRAGLYRSADGGVTWMQLCGTKADLDGLDNDADGSVDEPNEVQLSRFPIDAYALVSNPADPTHVYVALENGVYRSADGGLSWVDVSAGLTGLNRSAWNRLHLAITPLTDFGPRLLVGVQGLGIFVSDDEGEAWSTLPPIPDGSVFAGELLASPFGALTTAFPGSPPGAGTGHWYGDAFGAGWRRLAPAPDGSSPHVDGRDWVISAGNTMFESDDGGVYRMRDFNSSVPYWESANGSLRVTEFLSIAYDRLFEIVFGACWDNSIPQQTVPDGTRWGMNESFWGDGVQVGVDAVTAPPDSTVHYSSQQHWFQFRRRTYGSPTTLLSDESPGGPNGPVIQGTGGLHWNHVEGNLDDANQNDLGTVRFVQPWALHRFDGQRLLLGTDYLYESRDRGDSFVSLGGIGAHPRSGLPIPLNPVGTVTAYAYGHRDDAELLFVGTSGVARVPLPTGGLFAITTPRLWARNAPLNLTPFPILTYPGSTPWDIVFSPDDDTIVYVLDDGGRVWWTSDRGAIWDEVSGGTSAGGLGRLSRDLRTIEIVRVAGKDMVLVGGQGGVFALNDIADVVPPVWRKLGVAFPNAIVTDLQWDPADDVLVAGTYGRGTWKITNVSGAFADRTPGPPEITVGKPQCGDVINPFTPVTIATPDAQVTSVSYRFFLDGAAPPGYTAVPGASTTVTLDAPSGVYRLEAFASIAGSPGSPARRTLEVVDPGTLYLRCRIAKRLQPLIHQVTIVPNLSPTFATPLRRAAARMDAAALQVEAGQLTRSQRSVQSAIRSMLRFEGRVERHASRNRIAPGTRLQLLGMADDIVTDLLTTVTAPVCTVCDKVPQPFCGDGTCDAPVETCAACPADCGPCEECVCDARMLEICGKCRVACSQCCRLCNCGDGVCDEEEKCESCPADCGQCPPEP
jgi:hypothetical protein